MFSMFAFEIKVYFENDKMKLSVNKTKLTSLWARKWTTIQEVLILKFAFLPKKLLGLSGNEALERTISQELAWKKKSYIKCPNNWNDKTLEIDCYNKNLDRGVEILFECNILFVLRCG